MLNDFPIYIDANNKLIKRKTNFVIDKSNNNVYDYGEYNDIGLNNEPKHKLKLIGELIVYNGKEYPKYNGVKLVKLNNSY
jgi:hypothetical protein